MCLCSFAPFQLKKPKLRIDTYVGYVYPVGIVEVGTRKRSEFSLKIFWYKQEKNSEFSIKDALHNIGSRRQITVREWPVAARAINDAVQADDVVVLDPPRAGAGKAVMQALTRRSPRRVVYVSCDAATFARDIAVLTTQGYELTSLRAFDLFPQTEHVELVGVLNRVAPTA